MRNTSLSTAQQRSSTDGQKSDKLKLQEANVFTSINFIKWRTCAHHSLFPLWIVFQQEQFYQRNKETFYETVFTFIIRSSQGKAIKNEINMEFNAIEEETVYQSVFYVLGHGSQMI